MIELLNALKENGMIWFYLVSLISSDTLFTVEDCENSINLLKQTLEALPETNFDDEEKAKIKEHCINGIEICERDKEEFLKNKKI